MGDVGDDLGRAGDVDMKFGNVPANIVLGRIAQQRKLGAIGT